MGLKLYTNEDNPAVLKILIAHHLTKYEEKIQIELQSPHGSTS